MDVNQKGGEMTSPKNFNKIESDAHQMLGDIKIQEICQRHFVGEERYCSRAKNVIDRILLKLKFGDLVENNKLVLSAFNQETGSYLEFPRRARIRRILEDISKLLALGRK